MNYVKVHPLIDKQSIRPTMVQQRLTRYAVFATSAFGGAKLLTIFKIFVKLLSSVS